MSTRLVFAMHPLRTLLAVILYALTPGLESAEADDWGQDFQGDVIVDSIARYDRLPVRLFQLPEFREPDIPRHLPETFLNFFVRVLEGDYDNELHKDAAQSLERVAHENLAPTENYVPAVRSRLKKTESRTVIHACATTLIASGDQNSASELAALCRPDREALCLQVEPKIAQWNANLLLPQWRNRIADTRAYSTSLVVLACECLTAAQDKDSIETFGRIVRSEEEQFGIRRAAAGAMSALDSDQATEIAATLVSGPTTDRVVAVKLLSKTSAEVGLRMLNSLTNDPNHAVASLAWETLERLDRKRLVDRLSNTVNHDEANIRRVAIRVMERIPSELHCSLLGRMMADLHLDVRNAAREALHALASTRPDLRDLILKSAGRIVGDTDSNWQQLEQALLLLGQQKHSAYQKEATALLTHERHEVYVTSAWLIHLMPKQELSDEVVRVARIRNQFLKGNNSELPLRVVNAASIQLMYLFHAAASADRADLSPTAKEMFSKTAPALPETRAVGLWALGVLLESSGDRNDVREKLLERVHDDSEEQPEEIVVKSASALGLGELGMTESIAGLQLAHEKYGILGELGQSVSHALEMLGEPRPPVPEWESQVIGGWDLAPSFHKQ